MSTPTLAAVKGVTAMPSCARIDATLPSEPRRGQLAPPPARTTASAVSRDRVPSAARNRRVPSASQPRKVERVRKTTFCAASRPSQARRSGEAFMAFGKIRSDGPVKVGCPSASDHWIRASRSKRARIGFSRSSAVP